MQTEELLAEVRIKALRYDQTIRMLEEMIKNEREWAQQKHEGIGLALSGDVTFAHAHISTGDLNNRAIRLGVLSDILGAMKR